MNRLALVQARRAPPFSNRGAPGVDHYLDLEIDGTRLYDIVEAAVGERNDVISPLTFEAPNSAIGLIDALLGTNDQLWQEYDADAGEVPIYVCPIDYDLLCGGFVARLRRSANDVVLRSFRYVSTDDAAMRDSTEKMADLQFHFAPTQFDDVLLAARAELVAATAAIQQSPHSSSSMKRRFRRLFTRDT